MSNNLPNTISVNEENSTSPNLINIVYRSDECLPFAGKTNSEITAILKETMKMDKNLLALNGLIHVLDKDYALDRDIATTQTLTNILKLFNEPVNGFLYISSGYESINNWIKKNRNNLNRVRYELTEGRGNYVSMLKEAVKNCISNEQYREIQTSAELTGEHTTLYRDYTHNFDETVKKIWNNGITYFKGELDYLENLNIIRYIIPNPKPKGGSRRRLLKKTRRPTLRKNKTKRRR